MKIAVSTKRFTRVCGHAGQTRHWLIYDLAGQQEQPVPAQILLEKQQTIHYFAGDGAHPLDGVALVITGSAGDGFIRRMRARGAEVLKTGELDPAHAVALYQAGQAQPEPKFDVTTSLCKVFDLFSKH